ncbi:MAG TPA: class I SAM-dependent methyltransferase [Acidimicrobiales bacterium]|jgi:SAM-dependent methyltransferase|nr:class I SAM-dependent methyltransferase [Acidimicrobiales bacterium]
MARYPQSTAELDGAERRWWSENGDLEHDYCWVQTPPVQRLLRGGYLRTVTELVDPASSVLELGCGTGWFSLLLASMGVSNVVGVDFSPDQIAQARLGAKEAGLEERVHFEVADGSDTRKRVKFDLVVMHAFLHHLATDEVRSAVDQACDHLVDGGRLVVVEPVHFPGATVREPATLRALRLLEGLPRRLHDMGRRPMGQRESEVRGRLAIRHSGEAPFGPSPKEMPFGPGELDELLAPHFSIDVRRRCICMSHLVAQELLIAGLSQPKLWRVLRLPILVLARTLDGLLMRRGTLPSTVWAFQLFVCTKRGA